MVGNIYYIEMPYSNFKQFKGRPVIIFKEIDKSDFLVLPLTSNLQREGMLITNTDIVKGSLKKESVIVVPKITAIDHSLICDTHFIASISKQSFKKLETIICNKLNC
jgi:hypothetical protein